MSDIIELLPDLVANQIAAGEVIQRPASTVKELMENAIDAGSSHIQLIIKDAGKALIQVIDDGKGMSETDARMSIERHATSKLKTADDLFALNTFGFRGEALASMAAISHLTINTKREEDDLGTQLQIEGNKVKSQEPEQCAKGTSVAIRNLFYNVPARRNFLKSNAVETKHIIDEFQKVALINPDKYFELHHDENELFHLPAGSFRQRIIDIFGNGYNEKLVPVEEETNILLINGYIGKPEFAKKTRGEQYFFVNNRFIKSPYLHHAVTNAYDQLLPKKNHPSYFLMLEIDPAMIDINIHPTKTEVKFENEKELYAIIMASVKNSLGKYNIVPSLDFEMEADITPNTLRPQHIEIPQIKIDPDYNPFADSSSSISSGSAYTKPQATPLEKPNKDNWEKLFTEQEVTIGGTADINIQTEDVVQGVFAPEWEEEQEVNTEDQSFSIQIKNRYLITETESGMMIIDQQRAHERVIYESCLADLSNQQVIAQQLLFPINISLSAGDNVLFGEIIGDLAALGFEIENFGKQSYVVQARPSLISDENVKDVIDSIIEELKTETNGNSFGNHEKIALSLAKRTAVQNGRILKQEERDQLIASLFACQMPNVSPEGKAILKTINLKDIAKLLED
ncbi:MAG: DNA mismatch repair endonuclease MutL [Flavobacteriales bacterium]|nr:DNA mismatch repair endonuclease MutL [Flavobacteriales bacterium]